MKKTIVFAFAAILAACSPKQAQDYPIQGVPLDHVHFTEGLLAEKERVVRENTIPFAFQKCENTGRIANFARAAGLDTTKFTGLRYDDSDVFKVMEAASYSLATRYDAELDQYMDSLIALVGAAQEPDGYLYTIRTSGGVDVDSKAGPERWSNIADSHELYNVGHMYEAAVAHYLATGKTTFLDIAKRSADLIYDTFLVPGRKIVPGHEEIELALVKLYRATGDKRYLDLSHFLLECRGYDGETAMYMQSHKPVSEQYEAVGHAVRGVYLYMAMVDNAVLCGDESYRIAVDSLWNDVTDRKMYLTGGLGSYRQRERFGEAYFLPDEETHCETCAGVGSCMWNYRMFCLTGESRYYDIFERTLYNNVLHGISDDGMKFFYANVLQCSPYTFDWEKEWARIRPASRLRRSHRLPWFATSCCPTNLARILLSLPGYVYAQGKNSIYVNLFTAGQSAFETAAGEAVELRCETAYPYDGSVRLTLDRAPAKATALHIRIPGWAQGHPVSGTLYAYLNDAPSMPVVLVNGDAVRYAMEKGYAVLDRKWKDGDVVDIRFEMPLRFVKADDKVEAARGRIAVERGPIIYCAVLPENDRQDIRSCTISPEDRFEERSHDSDSGFISLMDTDRHLSFIPYYRHAQEGITQMSVWLRMQ